MQRIANNWTSPPKKAFIRDLQHPQALEYLKAMLSHEKSPLLICQFSMSKYYHKMHICCLKPI